MFNLAVIIPSAGAGRRFGSILPKPFVLLKGRPILQRTVDLFASLPYVKQIIIPTSGHLMNRTREIFGTYRLPIKIIEGGDTRQYSINNAIPYLDNSNDLVAVHDAVRPFVSTDAITKCCGEALKVGGAVVGIKARDTIKKVDKHDFVLETPNRDNLWQCQTPQIFKRDIFIEAYKHASQKKFLGTDDASVVEFYGKPVKMVKGNIENIKITYPFDLIVAESLLEEKPEK